MFRLCFVAVLIATLFVLACGETETEPRFERDLAAYEFGGSYELPANVTLRNDPEGLANLNALRNFIWEHWQDCQLGYVDVLRFSADWSATVRYYIEPGGGWSPRCTVVRESLVSMPGRHTLIHTFYYVERVEEEEGFVLELWSEPFHL